MDRGTRIQEYEVWGKIGGGGMSDVWLARHALLSVPVVLKTMKAGLGAGDCYERMLNEARLMARVHSDRVVRAIGVGVHEGTPYLVQDYIDGIDLAEMDRRRRRALGRGLPLWFVAYAVARIAEGLHAAHLAGVVHRDLKPSNVFGSPQAGIKLGDFGIAVGKGVSDAATREVGGTIKFMAPEALRGEAVDWRSDVYGLGATAFDLRYDFHPYPDVLSVLHGSPRAAFPPPVGPEEAYFQHVVARMLALRADDRYPSLSEPRRLFAALARSLERPIRGTRHDGTILIGGTRVLFEASDIARAEADGIVCSSLPEMKMVTGVGRALLAAGGEEIELEAIAGGEQPLGACVVTTAGKLRAKKVLHAVSAWNEASCIGRAMQRALLSAEENELETIAVPALGTGAARVSIEAAAAAEAAALKWHLALGGSKLREIRFVLADDAKLSAFRAVVEDVLVGAAEPEKHESGLPNEDFARDRVTIDGPTFVTPTVGSAIRRTGVL